MKIKSRARGDREPSGKTKAAILLYLAEHGESTFTEIREHMLDQYNIRSQKDIRGHLNDLSDTSRFDLLDKLSNGNGNACSYRVREGFCSLRKLYNYLKMQGLETEVMRTRYFHEYTKSCDFFQNVKTHLLGDILADLHGCMVSESGSDTILDSLDHVPSQHREILADWMARVRQRDMAEPLAGSFLRLIHALRSPEAETVARSYVRVVMERGLKAISPEQFDMLASDILIPDRYRERITAIMRLSPGAFDCIANMNCDNPLFVRNPFLAYVISLLLAQGETISHPCLTLAQCSEYAAGIPRLSAESPIFTIARSHFITDLVAGRLAVKEVPAETLRLIFSNVA